MKRTSLFLGILTLGALAWAADSIWMLREGDGPLGMWSVLYAVNQGTWLERSRLRLNLPLFLVGTFLPLILVGALWVWRWARSSNG